MVNINEWRHGDLYISSIQGSGYNYGSERDRIIEQTSASRDTDNFAMTPVDNNATQRIEIRDSEVDPCFLPSWLNTTNIVIGCICTVIIAITGLLVYVSHRNNNSN